MTTTALSGLEAQKAYVQSLRERNFKFTGITVGTAFVRGMRDIGYKHTGTALAELIDNADQAGADNVHVVFGYEGKSKKPVQLAVVDDGHGMVPEMIRLATMWGGTHRENDRSGFGRFGYGLPSASMSQGRRFTVYSKPEGEDLYAVTIDLDDMEADKYTNPDGDIVMPEAQRAELPRFVQDHIKKHLPGGVWNKGTVVILEKLDRLTWKRTGDLQEHLLVHFGVTYYKVRDRLDICVNDVRVDPIDPLFLTPGFRWYDLDADRAQALDPMRIEVKDPETRQIVGHIEVRFSYMPPSFASVDKARKADARNQNPRFHILKEYNGFIFARMGRVIDVVRHSPLTTFQNNDRYIKIEIDFSAVLDEEFNVPTSKQRVDVSARIWEILKNNGMVQALRQLRSKFREEQIGLLAQREEREREKRASEEAMERAAKMNARPSPERAARQQARGERRLRQEAEKRAAETGMSVKEAERQLQLELEDRPYKVGRRSLPGAPFFSVERWGGTKVLFLNTATRFYQNVYFGPNSNPAVRSALEILLFCIGDRILEASEDLEKIYAHEVPAWSQKLEFALAELAENVAANDSAEDDIARDESQAAE